MDSKELNLAFGARVRQLRKMRSMSQVELGRAIGKSQDTISNIETGRAGTRLETAFAISQALDVEFDQVFRFHAKDCERHRALDQIMDQLRQEPVEKIVAVQDLIQAAKRVSDGG